MAIDYAELTDRYPGFGPRVVAAGRFIVPKDGHAAAVGVEVHNADEARRAADTQIADGAKVVKIMASGGFSSHTDPRAEGLDVFQMQAIVAAAHSAGIKVAAHAHSENGIAAALEAGVDSIEHGAYISRDEIASILARNAVLVPTLACMEYIEHGRGVPRWIAEPCIQERPRYYENIRQAILAGVPVATGTDAGSELTPHGRVVDEIALLQHLGASTTRSLQAATVVAGRLIGDDIGELRAGAAADLILVDGDPRNDLDTLLRPRTVITRGIILDATRLERLAAVAALDL
jgi:imidazolonepropionase-like amidohydrolase